MFKSINTAHRKEDREFDTPGLYELRKENVVILVTDDPVDSLMRRGVVVWSASPEWKIGDRPECYIRDFRPYFGEISLQSW